MLLNLMSLLSPLFAFFHFICSFSLCISTIFVKVTKFAKILYILEFRIINKENNIQLKSHLRQMTHHSVQSVRQLVEDDTQTHHLPSIRSQANQNASQTDNYEQEQRKKRLTSITDITKNNMNESIKTGKKIIKIKAEQNRRPSKVSVQQKQCRICLQGEQEGRMIRPCICSGSITYAHQKCIIQWIKHKHDPKNGKVRIACQMCNSTFSYKSSRRRQLNLQQFCNSYAKEKCNFITFYTFIGILLAAIVGLIFIVCESGSQNQVGNSLRNSLVKNQNMKIVYICIVFILVIVLMFLSILFVIEYGVKTQLVITEVLNYGEHSGKKKMRVHPKTSQYYDEINGNNQSDQRNQSINRIHNRLNRVAY